MARIGPQVAREEKGEPRLIAPRVHRRSHARVEDALRSWRRRRCRQGRPHRSAGNCAECWDNRAERTHAKCQRHGHGGQRAIRHHSKRLSITHNTCGARRARTEGKEKAGSRRKEKRTQTGTTWWWTGKDGKHSEDGTAGTSKGMWEKGREEKRRRIGVGGRVKGRWRERNTNTHTQTLTGNVCLCALIVHLADRGTWDRSRAG